MPWYVNGELLDDAAVRAEAQMMRPRYMETVTDMDPIEAEMQLREWSRENVIERVLLRQEALADPEPVPAEVIAKGLEAIKAEPGGRAGLGTNTSDDEIAKQVELQYRIERLVTRLQDQVKPPKSKDAGDYYTKHRDEFITPELVHAAHIVKNVNEQQDEATARAAIEEADAKLQSGAEFSCVADQYSDCAGNGGDLGWFSRGEMVEEFDQMLFSMEEGTTSAIFRTEFGFHIARLNQRRAAGPRPFTEVKEAIETQLWQEKRNKALEQYLDQLRAKAAIEQKSKAVG